VSNATPGTPRCEYANSVLQRLCAAFHSVAYNIEAAGAQQKHNYDCRMKHTAYEPGDLVWVDSGTSDIGVNYKLLDQRDPRAKHKVIYSNRLKPYRAAWAA